MNIREIRPATVNNFDIPKFKPEESVKADVATLQLDKIEINQPQNWQQDILLSGLDMLENKIQLSNSSSPLDRIENKPIETFAEALNELNFIKTDLFKSQASFAQANLAPEILIDLMAEVA